MKKKINSFVLLQLLKRKLFFSVLFLLFATLLFAQSKKSLIKESPLEHVFDSPPVSTRPYVFWYWISNNISKEGIRKDLEALARVGIGGVIIGQIGYKDSPVGDVTMFSDAWWDCMTFALQEADRLGIKVSLFNSPGWSGVGGPWIEPEQSMRYLDIHSYQVKGPQKLVMKLPKYESNKLVPQSSTSFEYVIDHSKFKFQQVGVWVFPLPKGSDIFSVKKDSILSIPVIEGLGAMFDGDEKTKTSLFDLPVTIELNAKQKFTARSIEIVPADTSLNIYCELEYLNNQNDWKKITSFLVNRKETRILASGFLPFAPVATSFSPVSANKFRLKLIVPSSGAIQKSNTGQKMEVARIAEIRLSAAPAVSNYAEKQLANKAAYEKQTLPLRLSDDTALVIKKEEVIDISNEVDTSGTLTWNVPPGEWIIQHEGMLQTGVKVHPVPQNFENGFAADILSKASNQANFDAYIGKILNRIPADKRKALTGILIDSYEQGTANWTDGFAGKFKAAYGYDPMPWTPVFKGYVVESPEQSERFLWDLRRLVADLMPENFEGGLKEKCRANGLTLWHEAYGGHGFPGEFFNNGKFSDVSAAEFWSAEKPGDNFPQCRAASSIANICGTNLVSAEAFTAAQSYLYKLMPRDFKVLGDWAFAQGINHFTFHVSVHQPNDDKPGLNTWYGAEFNRNNNWFQDAKTYIDYVKRCSALLQKGQRQTDIAIFIGEDVPCDKPAVPYELPKGYDFDFINFETLVKLAKMENGRLVFPSGASYRMLILPKSTAMRPELLYKLEELVKEGLIMYGTRPVESPSLQNYPTADSTVQVIASRLWGQIDGKEIVSNGYGRGKIFDGISINQCFAELGLTADVELPTDFVYTHRRDQETEIYFIANQKKEQRQLEFSFRVTGMQPEYWNALTGERRSLSNYTIKNGRTVLTVDFPPSGSCFIVFFAKSKIPDNSKANFPVYEQVKTISGNWNVKFSSDVASTFSRTFGQLTDWSLSEDKAVKYFCGKATYSIDFLFDGLSHGQWYLNLGRVESLAKVRLNGKEIDTLWCYPYRVNVSGYLKKGTNKLEVDIVNQWWNRLIGDEQQGAVPSTKVSARLFWKASDALVPSGLMGPVVLETVK